MLSHCDYSRYKEVAASGQEINQHIWGSINEGLGSSVVDIDPLPARGTRVKTLVPKHVIANNSRNLSPAVYMSDAYLENCSHWYHSVLLLHAVHFYSFTEKAATSITIEQANPISTDTFQTGNALVS